MQYAINGLERVNICFHEGVAYHPGRDAGAELKTQFRRPVSLDGSTQGFELPQLRFHRLNLLREYLHRGSTLE